MFVTLPTVHKEWDEATKKPIPTKGSIRVGINTSILAHLRWEQQFQSYKENKDLSTVISEVQTKIEKAAKNPSNIYSFLTDMLRILYCFIESNDLPTFTEFLKIIDDNPVEILEVLSVVLSENAKLSSKN